MADKNIQMKKKNSDGTFDDYFPITKNENVLGGRVVTGNFTNSTAPTFSKTINLGFRPKYVKCFWDIDGDGNLIILEKIDGSPIDVMHNSNVGHKDSTSNGTIQITITNSGFTVKGVVGDIGYTISYIAVG